MEVPIAAKVFFSCCILMVPSMWTYLQDDKVLSSIGRNFCIVLGVISTIAMLWGLWSL